MNANKKQNQTLSPAEKSIQPLNYSGWWSRHWGPSAISPGSWQGALLEPKALKSALGRLAAGAQGSTNVPTGRSSMIEGSISPGQTGTVHSSRC